MTSPDERIFLSPPDAGSAEREALLRAFDSGWIAPVGAELDGFEQELAAYVDAQSCVAVSSGTAALRLALELFGIGAGDEVVVATATFAASAFAVVHAGATPVFCDAETDTWCLDPDLLAEFLTERARLGRLPAAVMPVALYGSAPDYERLREVCANHGVPIIEDAAEALGSIAHAGRVGSFDHPAIFSFNGNKTITTSSGGAFVGTPEQVAKVRHLSTQARMPVIHYEHEEIGFNFRLSNLLAAMGRAQLARIETMIERTTEINHRYRQAFPAWQWCPYAYTARPNHWLSVALLPEGDPIEISATMNDRNIEVRPAWKPMHQQPVFEGFELIGSGRVADDLFARGLCLPSGSAMTDDQLDRVVAAMSEVVHA